MTTTTPHRNGTTTGGDPTVAYRPGFRPTTTPATTRATTTPATLVSVGTDTARAAAPTIARAARAVARTRDYVLPLAGLAALVVAAATIHPVAGWTAAGVALFAATWILRPPTVPEAAPVTLAVVEAIYAAGRSGMTPAEIHATLTTEEPTGAQ